MNNDAPWYVFQFGGTGSPCKIATWEEFVAAAVNRAGTPRRVMSIFGVDEPMAVQLCHLFLPKSKGVVDEKGVAP